MDRPDRRLPHAAADPAYWTYLRRAVPNYFEATLHPEPWPDAPRGRTRREILARRQG